MQIVYAFGGPRLSNACIFIDNSMIFTVNTIDGILKSVEKAERFIGRILPWVIRCVFFSVFFTECTRNFLRPCSRATGCYWRYGRSVTLCKERGIDAVRRVARMTNLHSRVHTRREFIWTVVRKKFDPIILCWIRYTLLFKEFYKSFVSLKRWIIKKFFQLKYFTYPIFRLIKFLCNIILNYTQCINNATSEYK